MENFITKENLPDIIRDLAEEFLKHSNRVSVSVEMVKLTQTTKPRVRISVQEVENWTVIKEEEFEIIDTPMDGCDVIDLMIDTPIYELNKTPNVQ